MTQRHDGQDRPWNVPFRRNPFFTGRDHLLDYLHKQLNGNSAAALVQSQALTGLGGIGKTQVALEYAYRYRESYEAVFWVRAASRDVLIADFVALASLLELLGREVQDQMIVVAAVKHWLATHPGWLLILDNADDLSLVADFIPSGTGGCTVLTTRAQATGQIAIGIAVDKMDKQEGALLLLRRAKVLAPGSSLDMAPPAALAHAEAIVHALDGLPLALDQAGAYIEEVGCSLEEYLNSYQQSRIDLLQRQSEVPSGYPYTVSSTWSLSFQQVEQINPAAADLLRLCAFLDPDIIPEAIITDGASVLGVLLAPVASHALQLHRAIGVLRRFSLVKRNPDARLLNIHRLVQAILKSNMNVETQRLWAERAVRAVNAVFPEVAFSNWAFCGLCIPQAQACLKLVDQYQLVFPDAARLLHRAGYYLTERGLLRSAEPFLQRALDIRERTLGSEHLDAVDTRQFLAYLYLTQGKYEQAEALYQQALDIRERVQGNTHPDTAATLDDLALVYSLQSQYGLAETLLQRSLAIKVEVLGPDHINVAQTLDNLARLYYLQGQYDQSEVYMKRALTIVEQVSGPEDPGMGILLGNMAYLMRVLGRYEQAESLHLQSLRIKEQAFGPEHHSVAFSLDSLALLYQLQGKYEQAEPLCQRALNIRKQAFGLEHPDTAGTLENLALLYTAQEKYAEAESLHRQALATRERVLRSTHPDIANSLTNLASLYNVQGAYERAEPLFQRALAIREQAQGPEHPDTATTLNHLADLYWNQGQYEQARPLYQRTLSIREKKLGLEHPDTVAALKDYTRLLQKLEPTTNATKGKERDATLLPRSESRSTAPVKGAAYPGGLTSRELEVLCLLSQGLTSVQIAERLVLSLLTVNTHVRSIYSKLGVTSRSAATRWAIEHQLL